MNKYIIASHGHLAEGFMKTIELLTHRSDIHVITAYTDDEFPTNLISLMNTFEENADVIIFTDVMCGSVTQKIIELYGANPHLHLFAGVNLSLILEVILSDQIPDENYCNNVVQSAREQICYLHSALNTRE